MGHRWVASLGPYNFTLHYKPGKLNCDADALSRINWESVSPEIIRRGLHTTGNRGNAPPEKTQSLPASSRESSTEPMDMDDARRASEEIYRRIRQQAGLSRSGSVGDITLQPEPLGIMT